MNTRYLIIAVLAFALGLGADALWHRSQVAGPQVTAWCDPAHKIPFVDAEHCSGMTSCDRVAFLRGFGGPIENIIPCPKLRN
jgi:hypothetical protein